MFLTDLSFFVRKQIGSITKDPACGQTKGCFSDCTGTDCAFLLTWSRVSNSGRRKRQATTDRMRITMQGKVGASTSTYIAFGLSTDSKMVSKSTDLFFITNVWLYNVLVHFTLCTTNQFYSCSETDGMQTCEVRIL
jgi:hypothetical protein